MNVVDASGLVSITKSKDSINIMIRELGHHSFELLFGDVSITVSIKLAEGGLHIVQVVEGPLQLGKRLGAGGEHHLDELLHINLAVTIKVSLLEQGHNLVVRHLLTTTG